MPTDPNQSTDAAENLPWRPRPQAPSESFTSLRQWREQARAQTGEQQTVAPPPMTTATAETPARPTDRVAALDPPTRIRPAQRPGKDKERHADAPTLQQRVSAVITGIVGLVIMVVLIARPLLTAHANQPPKNNASNSVFYLPTNTPAPSYVPIMLDIAHPPPLLWAESDIVMDETNGAVLYAKNPDEQLPMASTTKFMTAVVALSHAKPDQLITITADAANTFCTCVGLKVGEQYTLTELLYGMLMISGNDAAEAIADGVAGNVTTFVGWMNQTAVAMGLKNTHYINPHGLDDVGHYSSARDLALLGRYVLSIPVLQQISATRTYTMAATATHPKHDLVNLHESLWWYPGADGGKPGWTGGARFVDILSAARNGHRLIAVVMHSANDWVTDIRDLLNWGFNDFTWVSPRDIDKLHYIPFDDSYSYFNWDVPSRAILVGDQEYFPYSGYFVAGAFLTYFNQVNGLSTIGFPRGMPIPAANGTLSQKFDNATVTCNLATGACHK